MFASQLRQAAEAAPRFKLPDIARLLWQAFAAGSVTEAEAEALSAFIAGRQGSPTPGPAPVSVRRFVGSRPRTDESMARRRRWAASGRLPPQLAAQFTLAEVAVLAVVAAETVKRGDCRLCLDHLAALAGVSRSTVRATLRRARTLGIVTIEERRSSAWRTLPNIVRIVSREWQAWNRLARRAGEPKGGGISSRPTNTGLVGEGRQRPSKPQQGAFGRADGRLARARIATG